MEGIEIKVALGGGAEAILRLSGVEDWDSSQWPEAMLRLCQVEDWDESIPSEIFPGRIMRPPTPLEAHRIRQAITAQLPPGLTGPKNYN